MTGNATPSVAPQRFSPWTKIDSLKSEKIKISARSFELSRPGGNINIADAGSRAHHVLLNGNTQYPITLYLSRCESLRVEMYLEILFFFFFFLSLSLISNHSIV
jgi:hypothetical protein